MQRQRGGLVPIGEAFSDHERAGGGDPRRLAPGAPPLHPGRSGEPACRGQRSGPDLGFMVRMLALCSLPRTNPGNQHQYKRVNGPFKLIMSGSGDRQAPLRQLPRLLLAWSRPKRYGPKAASWF